MQPRDQELAYALVAFVDAAKLHGLGLLLNDQKVQHKGCDGIGVARDTIAKLTGNWDFLIPLLKHDDPGVRMNACFTLINDHYDLVVPVLHDLDENCVTEASTGAAMLLQMYGEPNTGSGFKKPDPRLFDKKPIPVFPR